MRINGSRNWTGCNPQVDFVYYYITNLPYQAEAQEAERFLSSAGDWPFQNGSVVMISFKIYRIIVKESKMKETVVSSFRFSVWLWQFSSCPTTEKAGQGSLHLSLPQSKMSDATEQKAVEAKAQVLSGLGDAKLKKAENVKDASNPVIEGALSV